jgi:hypothetical protein
VRKRGNSASYAPIGMKKAVTTNAAATTER